MSRSHLVAPTVLLLLSSLLLAAPAAEAAKSATGADTAQASLAFAVAKMLADEGSFREALESFEQAVELAPDDPYVRASYTELLARLAQLSRSPRYRQQQLRRAVDQAEAAHRLAPDDPDILRVVAQTYLTVAETDPQDTASLEAARQIFDRVRELAPGDVSVRLTLGQILLFQGQTDDAIAMFREAVAVSPENARAYGFLVEALKNAGRQDEAEQVYRDILAFDPTAEDARISLAELVGESGDHRGAIEVLRGGTPEFLASARVRQMLAVQLFLSGQMAASLAELDGAISSGGETPALGRLRALVLNAQGRNEEAASQLRRLLVESPEDADVALTLARVLVRLDRLDEATEVLSQTVARLEGSEAGGAEGLRLEWAEMLMNGQRWAKALDVVEPLEKASAPQLRLAAELLAAESLVQLERGDEALELLSRSEAEDPAAIAKRAELLLRLDRPDEAQALLDKLRGEGDETSALAAAMVYQRLERYSDTEALIESYLDGHPATPRLLYLIGSACEREGKIDAAVSWFRKLLEMDPDFSDALNYLGYMWAERGENLDEARTMIERAVELEPDNGAFIDSLGWVYYQLGRYPEALTQLERAVQLVPDDGTVLEHLADAYRAVGRVDDAKKTYERALGAADVETDRVRAKLGDLGAESNP
ncbi:MAG: tetratricopeptide repeat protein [Acidobacteria bacterium]|nr:tetratricopeptide repeat protein [Acidobacteriota bacterium]